jgi:hypothetical protein
MYTRRCLDFSTSLAASVILLGKTEQTSLAWIFNPTHIPLCQYVLIGFVRDVFDSNAVSYPHAKVDFQTRQYHHNIEELKASVKLGYHLCTVKHRAGASQPSSVDLSRESISELFILQRISCTGNARPWSLAGAS